MTLKKRVPLVVGNWKLHPKTLQEAEALAARVAKLHKKAETPYVGLAPVSLHMASVAKKTARSTVMVGAQMVSPFDLGAHTGHHSVKQCKDVGAEFAIIGHSEQRAGGVTDVMVHEKVVAVLKEKLIPIVCIGETKRDSNGDFYAHIEAQLQSITHTLTQAQVKKLVIAYEPIWAIGTGETATADDVQEMRLFIQKVLTASFDRKVAQSVRLLYGGSVKPHNAEQLHSGGGMDGFLVGGASLKAEDFMDIVGAVTS